MVALLQRLSRRPSRHALASRAHRARRRVLHPGRVERRPPAVVGDSWNSLTSASISTSRSPPLLLTLLLVNRAISGVPVSPCRLIAPAQWRHHVQGRPRSALEPAIAGVYQTPADPTRTAAGILAESPNPAAALVLSLRTEYRSETVD